MSLRLWLLSGSLLCLGGLLPWLVLRGETGDLALQRREINRALEAAGLRNIQWRQVQDPEMGQGVELKAEGDDQALRRGMIEILLRDPLRPDFIAAISPTGKAYLLKSTQLPTFIEDYLPQTPPTGESPE